MATYDGTSLSDTKTQNLHAKVTETIMDPHPFHMQVSIIV